MSTRSLSSQANDQPVQPGYCELICGKKASKYTDVDAGLLMVWKIVESNLNEIKALRDTLAARENEIVKLTSVNATLSKSIDELTRKMEGFGDSIPINVNQSASLEARVASLEKNCNATGLYSMAVKKGPTISEAILINKASQEIDNRAKLEKNIVLFGMDVDNLVDDKLNGAVDSVLSELDVNMDMVKDMKKHLSKDGKSGVVVVSFKDLIYRNKALRNAKNLKDKAEFSRIFVNRDRSLNERMAEKAVRVERNKKNEELPNIDNVGRKYGELNGRPFFYGIRNGEIRRIYKPTIDGGPSSN